MNSCILNFFLQVRHNGTIWNLKGRLKNIMNLLSSSCRESTLVSPTSSCHLDLQVMPMVDSEATSNFIDFAIADGHIILLYSGKPVVVRQTIRWRCFISGQINSLATIPFSVGNNSYHFSVLSAIKLRVSGII